MGVHTCIKIHVPCRVCKVVHPTVAPHTCVYTVIIPWCLYIGVCSVHALLFGIEMMWLCTHLYYKCTYIFSGLLVCRCAQWVRGYLIKTSCLQIHFHLQMHTSHVCCLGVPVCLCVCAYRSAYTYLCVHSEELRTEDDASSMCAYITLGASVCAIVSE